MQRYEIIHNTQCIIRNYLQNNMFFTPFLALFPVYYALYTKYV